MIHDPLLNLENLPPLNKKIGSKYFRYVSIIAVDDTHKDHLIIYTYGGGLLITDSEERKEFLEWYTKVHTKTSRVEYMTIPKTISGALGEW